MYTNIRDLQAVNSTALCQFSNDNSVCVRKLSALNTQQIYSSFNCYRCLISCFLQNSVLHSAHTRANAKNVDIFLHSPCHVRELCSVVMLKKQDTETKLWPASGTWSNQLDLAEFSLPDSFTIGSIWALVLFVSFPAVSTEKFNTGVLLIFFTSFLSCAQWHLNLKRPYRKQIPPF